MSEYYCGRMEQEDSHFEYQPSIEIDTYNDDADSRRCDSEQHYSAWAAEVIATKLTTGERRAAEMAYDIWTSNIRRAI